MFLNWKYVLHVNDRHKFSKLIFSLMKKVRARVAGLLPIILFKIKILVKFSINHGVEVLIWKFKLKIKIIKKNIDLVLFIGKIIFFYFKTIKKKKICKKIWKLSRRAKTFLLGAHEVRYDVVWHGSYVWMKRGGKASFRTNWCKVSLRSRQGS